MWRGGHWLRVGVRGREAGAPGQKVGDFGRTLARAHAAVWVPKQRPIWHVPGLAVEPACGVQKTDRWRFFWQRRV